MSVQLSELEQIRSVLDTLTSKWTLLVLNTLCEGPTRFNALRRAHAGITQKALTQCLRRLEAEGLIVRSVVSTAPVAVMYEVSTLGASLEPHLHGILNWSYDNRDAISRARMNFGERDDPAPAGVRN